MTAPIVHWESLVSSGRSGVAPARIVACTRRLARLLPDGESSSLYRQDVTCQSCLDADGEGGTRIVYCAGRG